MDIIPLTGDDDMNLDYFNDVTGENMTEYYNNCNFEKGAPLMCLVDNVPVVYGLNDLYSCPRGKTMFESVTRNFDWIYDLVANGGASHDCADGWIWDGEEGCLKVKL